MAAISQVIPNLLGGVNQQPDPNKIPGQVREAENVLLDPTFGCRKRPPTQFLATLANDIPEESKWFNIFRDSQERYVVASYNDSVNGFTIRAFEADSGVERTVSYEGDSRDYLTCDDIKSIKTLTIADYTLISNEEKIVSMDTATSDPAKQEALVNINQIAYNTTYTIDFLKDGDQLIQEKVFSASSLSVTPGSFEDSAGSSCSLAGAQSFVENGTGNKAGLGFRLEVNCNPTQVVNQTAGVTYPTGLRYELASRIQMFYTPIFGSAGSYGVGSTLTANRTTSNGNLVVRITARVSSSPNGNRYDTVSTSIVSYTAGGTGAKRLPWAVGNGGQITSGGVTMTVYVTSTSTTASTPDYSYKSVYSAKVTLNNGGANWRIGDSVSVTLNGKSYTITVTGERFGFAYASEASVSFTTAADTQAGALDVGQIVGGLVTEINALSAYTATPIGSTIYIERDDGREFNIQTRGGTADNAMTGVKGSVNDISYLPQQCIEGVVLKVRNTIDSSADDYYVRFVPASGDIPGQGSWEETVKPGIPTNLNPSTMPHALIRQSDGTFLLRPLSLVFDEVLSYAPREVGDEDTNPTPTFVGRAISGMFFFSNRLGFLSQDSVILSQPGDYFNYFVGSAIAVSDADPIDMTASSTKPANLKAALGTPQGLLLFAENDQFLLGTSDVAFGPATVKLTNISNYSYNSNVLPLETGVSVLFATEADTFTKVFEMALEAIEDRPIVSENTRIVPEYIPPNLLISSASANNSLCLFGTGNNTLYLFKFFNEGNKRSVAGWCKWIFSADVKLAEFNHDTGYFVTFNDGSHTLSRMEMLDDPETSPINAFGGKFTPRLDFYLLKEQTTTEEVDDTTTRIRLPTGSYQVTEEDAPDTVIDIILTVDGTATLFQTPEVQHDTTGYFIEVDSGIASEEYIVGTRYVMSVELPAFFIRQEKTSDRRNLPMVENAYIDLYYSGRYSVTLKRQGYLDVSIDLDVTPADVYLANEAALQEVMTKALPIYCRGDLAKVTITAPDPLPASITSYSWEGHYNRRGITNI